MRVSRRNVLSGGAIMAAFGRSRRGLAQPSPSGIVNIPSSLTATLPNFAIGTPNGLNFLTANHAGGQNGSGTLVALHTDKPVSQGAGSWETFEIVFSEGGPTLSQGTTRFALKTSGGFFLTALNGGGINGGENAPIHTDAQQAQQWERFTLLLNAGTNPFTGVFITPDGQHFVTATNGGGVGINPDIATPPIVSIVQQTPSFDENFTANLSYFDFFINLLDQNTGNPITTCSIMFLSQPLVYGPVLEGNTFMIGLSGKTEITIQAPGYPQTPFVADPTLPADAGGRGITLRLRYANPL